MRQRGNQNGPYEPGPHEQPQASMLPQDHQWGQYPQQPYGTPRPGYGYYPPPVQVNIIQNGPRRAVTKARKKSSKSGQLLLIVCTGGLWLVASPVIWLWHQFGPRKRVSTTYYE